MIFGAIFVSRLKNRQQGLKLPAEREFAQHKEVFRRSGYLFITVSRLSTMPCRRSGLKSRALPYRASGLMLYWLMSPFNIYGSIPFFFANAVALTNTVLSTFITPFKVLFLHNLWL